MVMTATGFATSADLNIIHFFLYVLEQFGQSKLLSLDSPDISASLSAMIFWEATFKLKNTLKEQSAIHGVPQCFVFLFFFNKVRQLECAVGHICTAEEADRVNIFVDENVSIFVHLCVCVSLRRTTLSPLFPSSLMTFSAVTQSCGVITSETVLAVLTAPCWVTPRCQITRYVGTQSDTEFKNGVRWINPCPSGNWQYEQRFKSFLPIHESHPETGMSGIRAAPKKNAKYLNQDMQTHCSSSRGT